MVKNRHSACWATNPDTLLFDTLRTAEIRATRLPVTENESVLSVTSVGKAQLRTAQAQLSRTGVQQAGIEPLPDGLRKRPFSENASAAIRKKIIRRLIPVLNLNSTGFDGNYLLIQGSLNSYRINLGSGFAQVKDRQKHINIIPEISTIRKNKKVSLPIEDDDTLYMILVKALFLQNDASIGMIRFYRYCGNACGLCPKPLFF